MLVGLDNIDVKYATQKGIKVMNTPCASTRSVAELTIGQIITIARFVNIANVTMRDGEWNKKKYIGKLSAFCGAVSAGYACGAAITYMLGGNFNQIANTIINTLANTSGIICDGAKPSCAAKISSALDAALLAHTMSMHDDVFHADEGIVKDDLEKTIRAVGYIGREGMKSTDIEVLNIMIDKVCP